MSYRGAQTPISNRYTRRVSITATPDVYHGHNRTASHSGTPI